MSKLIVFEIDTNAKNGCLNILALTNYKTLKVYNKLVSKLIVFKIDTVWNAKNGCFNILA